MSSKETVLALLEQNRGTFFSGEEIAVKLSVSRAAVWKAIKALQKEGYAITAVNNRGYCLAMNTDILSEQGIQKYLNCQEQIKELQVFSTVTSTNTLLKEMAEKGSPEGSVLIAQEQTAGRGRRGRAFESPAGTGIYMSILLRPQNFKADKAGRITTMAAVAMCEAIEKVGLSEEIKAQIKWVNDIFVNGKKVCGILTEGSMNLESGYLDYAILGCGINVYAPESGFSPAVEQVAGSVFGDQRTDDGKNLLAAEFLNRFMHYYLSDKQDYVNYYRERSLAIGRVVDVISGNDRKKAQVLNVDEECQLVVRYENGQTDLLNSGEISIKL